MFANLIDAITGGDTRFGGIVNAAPYLRFEIRNPRFKTKATAGEVFDGHLSQGEAKYSLLPIDMKLKALCLIYLSQESGHHIVFGDEISVRLDK